MDIEFWASRWREGRIGFHEGRANAFLERHVGRLGPPERRVLVPLCGKTEDMAFLAAQGHRVVGIEAVAQAAESFFREHGLTPAIEPRSEHIRAYVTDRITILSGDVFACTPAIVGVVDALYDRAALVALSAADRERYAALVRTLLAPGAKALVINTEYDTTRIEPPPHSVPEAEVRRLYAGARVEQIDEAPFENQKMRDAGVTAVERCFVVEP